MDTKEQLQSKLESLQQKFDEEPLFRYKSQTDEYEQELEFELQEKESTIAKLTESYSNLLEESRILKQKYTRNENEIASLLNEKDRLLEEISSLKESNRDLEHDNDQFEQTIRILTQSVEDLSEQLEETKENCILLKEELEETKLVSSTNTQRLKEMINEMKSEIETLVVKQKSSEIEHPFLNVLANFGQEPQGKSDFVLRNKTVEIAKKGEFFEFGKVFGGRQTDVFSEIKNSVFEALSGKSTCILAYGQTGSGKSRTIEGLVRMTVEYLKKVLDGTKVRLKLNFTEVYNETVHDFLKKSKFTKKWKKLMADSEVEITENWVEETEILVKKAMKIRKSQSENSQKTKRESKSHLIISLKLELELTEAKIVFCDLAGSEKLFYTEDEQEALKENILTQKSLSALKDVLLGVQNKSEKINYKQSILTNILQPFFSSANSSLTLILNCKLDQNSTLETLNTLSNFSPPKSLENEKKIWEEKTLRLLQKERSEKQNLLKRVEKFENVVSNYHHTLLAKNSKIRLLEIQVFENGNENNLELQTLKNELSTSKSKLEEAQKQLRILQIESEAEKSARLKKLDELKNKQFKFKNFSKEFNTQKLTFSPLSLLTN